MMRNLLTRSFFAAALLVTLPLCVLGEQAPDQKQLQRELQTLRAEIEKFQQMLEETRNERSTLEENLKQNEKKISELMKRIEEIKAELKAGKENISRLEKERRQLDAARLEQQDFIKRQIRAAYEMGNQGYLKVLLNQEDPHRLARILTYYDYFNRARAERIRDYTDTIASLRDVERRLEHQNAQLVKDRQALEARSETLLDVRADKEESLAALNRQIEQTGTRLEKMIADRKDLEALLEKITRSIASLPEPTDTAPFASRKGELLLPVTGNVTDRFGSSRSTGSIRWNGVFIEAAAGEPVHAVHYGRVVFSDWLRGFGLLLIINHGEGYMSLYGHNQVLYRETGDWVKAGEVIATVGNSGGQNRSGVYFEIRHAGKPTDPQLWCQARSDSDRAA